MKRKIWLAQSNNIKELQDLINASLDIIDPDDVIEVIIEPRSAVVNNNFSEAYFVQIHYIEN